MWPSPWHDAVACLSDPLAECHLGIVPRPVSMRSLAFCCSSKWLVWHALGIRQCLVFIHHVDEATDPEEAQKSNHEAPQHHQQPTRRRGRPRGATAGKATVVPFRGIYFSRRFMICRRQRRMMAGARWRDQLGGGDRRTIGHGSGRCIKRNRCSLLGAHKTRTTLGRASFLSLRESKQPHK